MTKWMLDTNVFGDLLDGTLHRDMLGGGVLIGTSVQRGELENTQNRGRREALIKLFEQFVDVCEPPSFALDILGAGFDEGIWSEEPVRAQRMFERLKQLDRESGKRTTNRNIWKDVLIGDAAMRHNTILLSADKNLRQAIAEFGGAARDSRVELGDEN